MSALNTRSGQKGERKTRNSKTMESVSTDEVPGAIVKADANSPAVDAVAEQSAAPEAGDGSQSGVISTHPYFDNIVER